MTHCIEKYPNSCDVRYENLASNSGTNNIETIFNQWYEEKSAFLRSGIINHYKGSHSWGHFSQIVWAENTEIGCALSKFSNHGDYNLLVCKYGVGNVINNKVFEAGHGSSSNDHEESKKIIIRKTTTRTTTTTTSIRITTQITSKASISETNAIQINNTSRASTKVVEQINKTIASNKDAQLPIASVTPAKAGSLSTPNTPNIQKEITETKEKEIVSNNENNNEDNNDSNIGTFATGVAITGTVIGAAAAFAFVKKNPKKYENIKRNITRKAISVKRGASVATRKLTTKVSNISQSHNKSNYRSSLVDSIQV